MTGQVGAAHPAREGAALSARGGTALSARGGTALSAHGGTAQSARECAGAVLLQLVLLAAFFWTPLSRYGTVHYSAADLTQAMSLTRIEPGHAPGNQLQSDAVTQMQPWLLFNRDELAQGRLPLWNPYNGAGCPHFANYQSAVFSPFSLPFYTLSFKAALLVSAALKLLALGLFTYLFLREIGCGWIAANAGAVAFTFAGHNSLLLYFPHVGAMVALPAGLFCAERALRIAESAIERAAAAAAAGVAAGTGAVVERVRMLAPCAGLTAAFVVGLLAGNPEPLYYAGWGVAVWSAARLVGLWRRHRRVAGARREVLRTAGKLAFALVMALALSAFQVLPFLDYLAESRVLEERSLRQVPLDPRWWPLLVHPDALGSPASPYNISLIVPLPNYELVNMSYVGGAATVLAIACPFVAGRRRGGLCWPILAGAWFLYAHDIWGTAQLLAHVPTLRLAPMNRSQGLWNFALAAAAAVALDELLRRERPRAWFGAGWFLAGAVALVIAALIGTDRLIREHATIPSPHHGKFLQYVPAHVGAMTLLTLGAAAAAASMLVLRGRWPRRALAAGVLAAVFAQSGWLLRDYNPVSPDHLVFPRTAAIEALQRHVGRERLAILGRDGLPPCSNLVYGLNQLSNYDGMWCADLDHLHRDQFGESDNWRPIVEGSHRSLRLFGTRWILAKWGWSFLDSGLADYVKNTALVPRRLEILPAQPVTQTFRCGQNQLSTVMVMLSTTPDVRLCTLRFQLEDVAAGRIVSDQAISSHDVRATVHVNRHVNWPGDWPLEPRGRPVVFRFDPVPDSAGREYRITLACEDGRAADTVFAWHLPLFSIPEVQTTHGQRKLTGELLFDWQCRTDAHYERVAELGEYTLLRLRDAVPVYSFTDGSVAAESAQEAFDLVRSFTFDPRRVVVLDPRDEDARRAVVEAIAAARQRRIVQFSDSPFCYLVGLDGRKLAHIDDEATFLANRFEWKQIERLPASRRSEFELVPDTDDAGKRAVGLIPISAPVASQGPPEVLEDTPTYVRLRVHRERPGFLVAANTYDPGWKARLSGTDVPLLRANYAFQAVEIPPGTWEVELRYWPDGLTHGLWLGAAAIAGIAVILARAARARRRAP